MEIEQASGGPGQPEFEDRQLVRMVLGGNTDAFGEIVAKYEKRIFNLALRYCGDSQEAEDLTQESFLRIFKALPSFRGEALFSTWVYRIVTNVCLDSLRRKKKRPEPILDQPLTTDSGELERELASPDPGPAHYAEVAERTEIIRREIASLREPYRSAIILRDLEGLSYEEIAEILNVSPGTVKSRIHRARMLLRERFIALELLSPGYVQQVRKTPEAKGDDEREQPARP